MPHPGLPIHSARARGLLAAGLLSLLLLVPGALVPDASPAASAAAEEGQADRAATASAGGERTRHLDWLGVHGWHDAGYLGQGVKVAILDSGWRGYREHLGHALPARVVSRSFRANGELEARDSKHGILVGEVIHTLAPEAELLVANWEPDDPGSFIEAVRWARREGVRVVSCSVISPLWSDGEGGGSVHRELARIVGPGKEPGDLLFFACAGNTAQRHWSGSFRDEDRDGYHEWEPGVEENGITPWGDERVSIELYCPARSSYELVVHDGTSGAEVGRAATEEGQKDRRSAVVRFQPRTGADYRVRVRLATGAKPEPFHLVALASYRLDHATARGSIAFPGDGAEVLAVGAVDADSRRLDYSACGPNSPRPKPDLAAPIPFPVSCRAQPFGGTSAAAPQAAALAALWWSRHPDWTAEQVRSALCGCARDLGPAGHDCETGHGLINLPPLRP